jgi:hypothetical protein
MSVTGGLVANCIKDTFLSTNLSTTEGDPEKRLWTRSRRERVRRAGFGIERIVEFDAPREWPSTGFQLGLVLITRGYAARAASSTCDARRGKTSTPSSKPGGARADRDDGAR